MDYLDLKNMMDKEFDTNVFLNSNNTITVYNVELSKVKEFVEKSEFKDLVHSVEYDYDYGYDEYCDPLTVAKDRVVLYCTVLCDMDFKSCDGCGKCE